MQSTNSAADRLQRHVGLAGAVLLGLGAIVGTGVFVSLTLALEVTGPSVVLAIFVSALLAAANGMSSAQLAANHPVSGGTYEYGYRWLNAAWGFQAGWLFLCAKSASAATAALGCASYLRALGYWQDSVWDIPLALACVVLLTGLVLIGVRRSNQVNAVIVSLTLLCLGAFVCAGLPSLWRAGGRSWQPFFLSADPVQAGVHFAEACALMFVAYTGYGRIATLGEEVHSPRRTIPWAIVITLLISAALYISVACVSVVTLGEADIRADGAVSPSEPRAVPATAPLVRIADSWEVPGLGWLLSAGAVTAMLGVLLNLILGLSRVVLAMGRRRDLPVLFGRLNAQGTTPVAAVLLVGGVIAGLVLIGNVKTTWSFSAFTVLMYYALTNLAALRLRPEELMYPRWIAVCGLAGCLSLAFWVETSAWLAGLTLMLLGGLWQVLKPRFS